MIRERIAAVLAQTNRYSAAVRKLLSIKGEEHNIGFGVHLEDERPEFSFIKGERIWIQYNEVTSAAGTMSVIGVDNPPGSGVLVVVTNVFLHLTVDALLSLVFSLTTSQVAGGSMWSRDGRWSTGASFATTARQIARTSAGLGGTALWSQFPCVANVLMDVMVNVGRVPPIILAPGNQLYVGPSAVGVNTMRATFAGYERPLESGELQP